jgi:hypothetical protein
MAKNMTIDTLAQMTANEFRTVGKRLDTGESTMREGFAAVLEELQGLNDSVKQARGASNVESAGLREKIEALEEDVQKIKQKVKI